jgi:glutamyl-Q tRNA(Asp) synthetase
MEDLDPERTVPGSADEILATLTALGLGWDGEILYQSERAHLYAEALATLGARGLTFECSCSRRELAAGHSGDRYPGTCRTGTARPGPTATRFRVDREAIISFDDRLQGPTHLSLDSLSDVIIRRRDGVFAYQLAVVVDDALQGVSDVVRGADLLSSSGWQIALQQALGLPSPRYAHLPVVVEAGHGKLSKSRQSLALECARPAAQLAAALCLLRMPPPPELTGAPPATLLDWATARWPPQGLAGLREIRVPGPAAH